MPTVLIDGPYRFFFYSADRNEPPHVHIERDKSSAKFWLDPIRINNSKGYTSVELNKLQQIVNRNRNILLKKWNEFFNS